jgi:DNA-binding GntR family transcriptional regulator
MTTEQTLRDLAVTHLRDLVFTGTLRPGDRVVERDIADSLGMSRLPVREAVQHLAREGILLARPNRAAVVRSFSEQDLIDLLQVRESLEVLAAALAARRVASNGGLGELAAIEDSLERARQALEAGREIDAEVEAGLWHELMIELSGNALLKTIMAPLSSQQRWLLRYNRHHEHMLDEHRKIFDAVCRGNDEEASRLAEEHVASSRAAFRLRATGGD